MYLHVNLNSRFELRFLFLSCCSLQSDGSSSWLIPSQIPKLLATCSDTPGKWVSREIISLCVSLVSSYSMLPFSPQMEHSLAPGQELLGHSSLTGCESVKLIGMFTKLKHVLVFSYFLIGNAVKIFKTLKLKNVWLLIHM